MRRTMAGLLLSVTMLTGVGCGGGGGSSDSSVGSGPPPPPPPPPSDFVGAEDYCPTLQGAVFDVPGTLQSAIVEQAEFVPATGGLDGDIADTCRIVGFIPDLTTEGGGIYFELLMPDDWNRTLLFLGVGGFAGELASSESTAGPLGNGYAVVSTDMGHSAGVFDASWALWSDEAVDNFYFAAIPKVAEAAKAIIGERYAEYVVYDSLDGTPYSGLARSLFEGCSGGGRQALMAAQRAPELFDGIIARAPGIGGTFEAFNRNAKLVAAGPLSAAKLATLDAAQLAACDVSSDGVADGIIDSYRCDFDPAGLLCAGGDADDCLTATELATVTGIRSATPLPYAQADGLTHYPGWPVASVAHPLAWPIWITPGLPPTFPQPFQFVVQEGAFRYLIAKDPGLDTLAVSAGDFPAELAALSAAMEATSPDLSAFATRGGRLILWHGEADAALSAESTRLYYESLLAFHSANPETPDPRTFAQLYLAPGVFHCSGGPGADRADLLGAMEYWLQQGELPPWHAERIDDATGAVELARPLCPYPQYARYDGVGDPDALSSFECVTPGS